MNATNNGSQSIYAGPGVIECADCKGAGEVPIDPDREGSGEPGKAAVKTCPTCKGKGERRKLLPGLTKREEFAKMAMQGLLADPNRETLAPQTTANLAVVAADSLLVSLSELTPAPDKP